MCRRLSERMYVTSHGGNLACRLEEDLLLITPTRMYKADIGEEDLVFIDLSGKKVEGRREPTGEQPMYLNLFRDRPDVRSIIHCHPPCTNAFAILKGSNWLMRPIFPETVVEVGPVPVVPYGEPLTQRLADNFLPFIKRYNAFLMENHGLVIASPANIRRTLDLVEILEVSSISLLKALAVGEVKELSREAQLAQLDLGGIARDRVPAVEDVVVPPGFSGQYCAHTASFFKASKTVATLPVCGYDSRQSGGALCPRTRLTRALCTK